MEFTEKLITIKNLSQETFDAILYACMLMDNLSRRKGSSSAIHKKVVEFLEEANKFCRDTPDVKTFIDYELNYKPEKS